MAVPDEPRRLTKNEKRRKKDKETKTLPEQQQLMAVDDNNNDLANVKIEYVSQDLAKDMDSSMLDQFKDIFEKFAKPEELTSDLIISTTLSASSAVSALEASTEASAELKALSKKKKKLMSRLSVAELKQLVNRPDVVEAHDVTSSDPKLLVFLKAHRNTVQVPRHWCLKRKYLQGKRGVEKPPFQLPEFIAETGIAKIRDSVIEQESMKKGRQKARDRLQPKMGKIDIDYQVLHDAFFKFQTKPKLSRHGELYYEGKEYETKAKECKPGVYTTELKVCLAMQDNGPPPWLVNMQRYGPPPSYPALKIPGLNAPLPSGASFGYHTGGWGKPPVDEYGRPLYGDVFAALTQDDPYRDSVDRTSRWGELEGAAEQDESESEDEEEASEEVAAVSEDRRAGRGGQAVDRSGIETPGSVTGSLLSGTGGLETPDIVDLRKRVSGSSGIDTPDNYYHQQQQQQQGHKELYHIIQERQVVGASTGQFFSSDKTYVLPGKGDVLLSVTDETEAQLRDPDAMQGAYEAGRGAGQGLDDDDARGKRKKRVDADTASKRHKDFKF